MIHILKFITLTKTKQKAKSFMIEIKLFYLKILNLSINKDFVILNNYKIYLLQ